jgi:hypothetical protein
LDKGANFSGNTTSNLTFLKSDSDLLYPNLTKGSTDRISSPRATATLEQGTKGKSQKDYLT